MTRYIGSVPANIPSYLDRRAGAILGARLSSNPAVALLGPRQSGKSTLAREFGEGFGPALRLDLERPSDLAKLQEPEAFFALHEDKLVVLDEIQRVPELFPVLRSVIDQRGRNGQFLILGSASPELIKQSSESLAGRLSFIELPPLTLDEIEERPLRRHWLCGGYPRSLLSREGEDSFQWRLDYIQAFLERDLSLLGVGIPSTTLRRLWTMLAHCQGQLLNASKLGASLGVSAHTVRRYIDLFEQCFVIRSLPPLIANTKKRLVKSPKVYIRDSGLLHTLLDIETQDQLLGHPVYGSSFEGYALENIIANCPRYRASFYRTAGGAEVDLVLERGEQRIAIEIKASSAPKVSRGFHSALEDLNPSEAYVVAPVEEPFPLASGVMVLPLRSIIEKHSSL